MTVSQPSKEVYAVNVPEIKNLTAQFVYNFFVPDESTNESGGVPISALTRASDAIDASFLQYCMTRVPRFVKLVWSTKKISDPGGRTTDLQIRNNANNSTGNQKGSLISDNLDKVIDEDQLSATGFAAITYHDGEIDTKLFDFVSGSYLTQAFNTQSDPNVSNYKAAMKLASLTPQQINSSFLYRAMGSQDISTGVRYYNEAQNEGQQTQIKSDYMDGLKHVTVNVQVNGKLLQDITNRQIKDPHCPYSADLAGVYRYASKLKNSLQQRTNSAISEEDYKTFVPYVSLQVKKTAYQHSQTGPEIVGYLIDKVEILPDGSTKSHPLIVVDNPKAGMSADFRVKFGATYFYTIRTVTLFTLPGIDDDTGDIAELKVLVSSKPSNKVYVVATEFTAPPPPTDLDFVWNYETSQLLLTWTFPPNPQQDIKKWQIFRRSSTDHPFELQKMYDFDDSTQPYPDVEDPDPLLIERLISPCNNYVDSEFTTKTNYSEKTAFIYAVVSIDAHGLTSGYSAQFAVWFDVFKNSLQKKLISHKNSPKAYPNLYIPRDLFVDTIRVQGPNTANLKLYFNPEFYYLYDDSNRFSSVLATNQTNGSYKLNFINLDNQKSQTVTITIDDRLPQNSQTTSTDSYNFVKAM